MDFTFSEEHVMLRDMIKKFVDKEVRPLARQIDEQEDIPMELIKKAAELGFLGMCYPEDVGGVGAGEIGYCILLEEFARGCASTTTMLAAHQSIGAYGIFVDGNDEQKKEVYGLFKQGSNGDNTAEKPGLMSGFEARGKWDAWEAKKGMSQDDAKQAYVEYCTPLLQ